MSWQRGTDDTIPANDPALSTIRSGFTAIEELCKDLLPVCEEEERKKIVEQLDTRMKNLIRSELLYQENPKIVVAALEAHPIPDETSEKDVFSTLDTIKKVCFKQAQDYVKEALTDDAITSNERYEHYQQVLSEALPEENSQEGGEDEENNDSGEDTDIEMNDVDDDLASMTGEIVPIVDPLTRKALKDPVKNIHCGHIYGKQSMLDLIKQNPRTRCPTGGCQNPDFIRPQHLRSDPELTRKVAMKLKQQKRQH